MTPANLSDMERRRRRIGEWAGRRSLNNAALQRCQGRAVFRGHSPPPAQRRFSGVGESWAAGQRSVRREPTGKPEPSRGSWPERPCTGHTRNAARLVPDRTSWFRPSMAGLLFSGHEQPTFQAGLADPQARAPLELTRDAHPPLNSPLRVTALPRLRRSCPAMASSQRNVIWLRTSRGSRVPIRICAPRL